MCSGVVYVKMQDLGVSTTLAVSRHNHDRRLLFSRGLLTVVFTIGSLAGF